MTSPTDEDLIARARRGDHAAYHALVARYTDAAFRVAFAIMRQAPDAEDVLQEAFTKAYIYLDKYSDRYRFYTWLATIVRNVALSHLKSRDWLSTPLSEDLLIPSRVVVEDSPELAALASSRALVVRETVDALPERYRRVLLLRYWSDLSYDEIAVVTEQSLGAVKTQIRRAKALVQTALLAKDMGPALE